MNAAIAKQRLAELVGGTRGQALRDAASTWFRAEGIPTRSASRASSPARSRRMMGG